jgi:hypothetical protein
MAGLENMEKRGLDETERMDVVYMEKSRRESNERVGMSKLI